MGEKLKTLKDIDLSGVDIIREKGKPKVSQDIIRKKLKQEIGIKWIKHFENMKKDDKLFTELFNYNSDEVFGAELILRKVFNISEEDLK